MYAFGSKRTERRLHFFNPLSGSYNYEDNDAAFYELVIQDVLSNQNITLSAPGVEIPRIEKLRRLSDFEPAQKMLHVCVRNSKNNCMTCGKCVHVVTALDALGTLDRFGAVFDLQYYREHKDEFWGQVIYRAQLDVHYAEVFTVLKQSNKTPGEGALCRARILASVHKASNAHRRALMENRE